MKIPGSKGHTCAADIAHLSRESDVALLDDRRKHKCVRESRWGCPECVIFCKKLNMNPFYERLKEEVCATLMSFDLPLRRITLTVLVEKSNSG